MNLYQRCRFWPWPTDAAFERLQVLGPSYSCMVNGTGEAHSCPERRSCRLTVCNWAHVGRGEVGDHVSFHHRLQTFSMSCSWRTWQWIGETGMLVLWISETHAWERKHYFCLLFSRRSVNKCAFMCLNTELPQISWKIHRIELVMWLVSKPGWFQGC